MFTRSDVVEKAREYLGTPFQHQGRIKRLACDCVGLPLMVAEELGILDRYGIPLLGTDNANYSDQPLDGFIHEECQRRLIEKPMEKMRDGDVLTIKFPTIPCHTAIVTTIYSCGCARGMIHAFSPIGKVVEHVIDAPMYKRIAGVFEYPGIV